MPALLGITPQYIPSNSFIKSSISLRISLFGINGPVLSTQTKLDLIKGSTTDVLSPFSKYHLLRLTRKRHQKDHIECFWCLLAGFNR